MWTAGLWLGIGDDPAAPRDEPDPIDPELESLFACEPDEGKPEDPWGYPESEQERCEDKWRPS